jgi:hypothetical protein
VECLGELERLCGLGCTDLYYGDESRVSMEPCVPYGWQFAGEGVFMLAAKGAGLNCFALLTRANDLLFETTRQRITSAFIIEQLERLSFSIKKLTVVVLDNARVHTSQQVQERRPFWQQRGLFGSGSIAREVVDSLAWSNSSATTAAAIDSSATA